MNILGISGSPRVKHTALMLKTVLDATGAEYELVHLKDYTIRPALTASSVTRRLLARRRTIYISFTKNLLKQT